MTFRRDPPANGIANMETDLKLLEREGSTCRLYEWDAVWVTLGRFQQAERDLVDPDRFPWIIRPTGGKAVLHGHDWTVGLAVPLAEIASAEWPVERLSRSVRQVYRIVVTPLVTALRGCGLPAALAESTAFVGGPRVADCFAHISTNDIVDERTGVKVCGCALRLTPKAVLVQASIPKGQPLVPPGEVIVDAEALPFVEWDWESFPESLQAILNGNR